MNDKKESSEINPQRYLNFSLNKRDFAFKLDGVREVIGFPDFTPIPQCPPHILGLLNIRDEVIRLVDLRLRLGMEPTLTHDTAVIICKFKTIVVGVVVDSISAVSNPELSSVASTPDMGGSDEKKSNFIPEVIRSESQLVLVLDIGEILSSDEQIFLGEILPDQKAA